MMMNFLGTLLNVNKYEEKADILQNGEGITKNHFLLYTVFSI